MESAARKPAAPGRLLVSTSTKTLSSVVGLHSSFRRAFSAETLGTERAGNGVLIDDGLVLTIGYLITEAEAVWLHRGDGRVGDRAPSRRRAASAGT
jgi:S1-C subfamily serine protease